MICTKCGNDRDEHTEFPKRHGKRNGRVCNSCKSVDIKAWFKKNPKYYKEYAARPGVGARLYEHKRKWVARNPEKRNAHMAVFHAVKRGELLKPDNCEDCGKPSEMIHGHHEDYTKPLDVVWLCPPCHMARHYDGSD